MQDVNYPADRKRGDSKTAETKRILGEALIHIANDHEDTEHNTDLMMVTPKGEIIRFSERWRFGDFTDEKIVKKFNKQYKYEVTFRCGKQSGSVTEWHKMIYDGYGDYNIYGWLDENGNIKSYVVIDLSEFRNWYLKNKPDITFARKGKVLKIHYKGEDIGYIHYVGNEYENGDEGHDYFYVFDWRKIPGIVVKTSVDWKEGNNDIR